MRVGVIGGGAAGFFAAISCKTHHPDAKVIILEKTSKTLSKVKISGGGRCNVTHDVDYTSSLIKNYPRGKSRLKKVFSQFGQSDTVKWFEERGVSLKIEEDGRMFPTTDQSQTIIDALWKEVDHLGIKVQLRQDVQSLLQKEDSWKVSLKHGDQILFDKVIITTGGHPKSHSYDWLRKLGLTIVEPVPSLFTFNMPFDPIKELMGVVCRATVSIPGTSLVEEGPVLITHWGMSGPAILKLSAWGARELAKRGYVFEVSINWTETLNDILVKEELSKNDSKKLKNLSPFSIPSRLWIHLIKKAGADEDVTWEYTPKKVKNKLIHTICQDRYQVSGKTTFKEEFVTCGGVALDDIDMKTMKAKDLVGLYLAGEVLDIDAVTGGFNFQAAWSTGYIAGKLS